MKSRYNSWKKWFLIPFLCMLLVLTGGCGKSGAGDSQQDEKQQELQKVEAAADNPASGDFDDRQEADAREESDTYDAETDYGGEETDESGEAYGESGSGQDSGENSDNGELDENGVYTTKEDVALYLHTYGKLPLNFMTKKEARSAGWSGGSLEEYAPGMCIGGDRFGNYEGVLPEGNYHECDINTLGEKRRGPERLVYSDDGRIYYTSDHYETFTLLYEGGK